MNDPLEGNRASPGGAAPTPANGTADPAKARFLMLSALRFSGVALALAGAYIAAGKTGLPVAAGYVLIVVGVVDAMILPLVLAKAWKSPKP